MKIKFLLAGVFTTLLVAGGAQAQGLFMPWLDDLTPLNDQDRAIIRSVVQQQIHGKPAGTVANWSNPAAGGHRGTIKLVSKTVKQGMPCEQIEYVILEPGTAQQHGRYVFTSCRLPDGTWKLAE